MSKLNMQLLKLVKQGFVPQPGGQGEPVAGASQMTAGMGAPMGDPAGGGGAPMDPAAMGEMGGMPMPPAGLDPAMAGMLGGAMPGGEGGAGGPGTMINMTSEEFLKFLKQIMAIASSAAPQQQQPAQPQPDGNGAKLDELIGLIKGQLGG